MEMQMNVHASCHCGQIKFTALVDSAQVTICHCHACQKLTGTAYRVSVPALPGSFKLLAGEPTVYERLGDSGARRAQAFCGRCGSLLYAYGADGPRVYGLRVGVLDEREALAPARQKWCSSALPWAQDITGLARAEGEA